MPLSADYGRLNHYTAREACLEQDSNSREPSRDELSALFYNKCAY